MKIKQYLTIVPNGIYDVHVKLILFKILDFFHFFDSGKFCAKKKKDK